MTLLLLITDTEKWFEDGEANPKTNQFFPGVEKILPGFIKCVSAFFQPHGHRQ